MMLLWTFASVVILLAQCVIVWKAYQIFNAVVAREMEQKDRVIARIEELFAKAPAPGREAEAVLGKMQETYLEHLETVRKKQEQRFDELLAQRSKVHEEALLLKDERIDLLTREARWARGMASPGLLAAIEAERAAAAGEGGGVTVKQSRDAHIYWIGHALLWAVAIDPETGLEAALENLRGAGLANLQLPGERWTTLEAAVARQLEQARSLNPGDVDARRALTDELIALRGALARAL